MVQFINTPLFTVMQPMLLLGAYNRFPPVSIWCQWILTGKTCRQSVLACQYVTQTVSYNWRISCYLQHFPHCLSSVPNCMEKFWSTTHPHGQLFVNTVFLQWKTNPSYATNLFNIHDDNIQYKQTNKQETSRK